MTNQGRSVTLVIHHDGELESQVLKIPAWLYQALKIAAGVFLFCVVMGSILYAPIIRTAARVPGMTAEIERLTEQNAQVRQLSETLTALEGRYDQIRTALGANVIPELGANAGADALPTGLIVHARLPFDTAGYETGPTLPIYWPLDTLFQAGVLTRRQALEGGASVRHRGIDIAVRTGTPIRAAGGGRVREAGFDKEYGWFVLLDHLDGYQTMYGHASRLLVSAGDSVNAGQIIALAGSTGRSTAPHLHFEKRKGSELIDPLERLSKEQ
jgi:murein DD-endopeptidase MepM/ murein hydrolase activator NlpD